MPDSPVIGDAALPIENGLGVITRFHIRFPKIAITDVYLGGLCISFAFKGKEIGVFMTKQAEWFLDEYSGFAGGRRTE